jgi:hypothetical protein
MGAAAAVFDEMNAKRYTVIVNWFCGDSLRWSSVGE